MFEPMTFFLLLIKGAIVMTNQPYKTEIKTSDPEEPGTDKTLTPRSWSVKLSLDGAPAKFGRWAWKFLNLSNQRSQVKYQ